MNKRIHKIASRVRRQCEIFSCKDECGGKDYFNNHDLSCMCAVASYTLAKALKKNGIVCKMVKGMFEDDHHCWVEIKNEIVDITATQFGIRNRVYFTNKSNECYKRKVIIRSPRQLRSWKNQAPDNSLANKILKIA